MISFYARIVVLGTTDEKEARERVAGLILDNSDLDIMIDESLTTKELR
jgi:hypothetical protein